MKDATGTEDMAGVKDAMTGVKDVTEAKTTTGAEKEEEIGAETTKNGISDEEERG